MTPKKNIFSFFPSDFAASVVIFLVALPLCLGIALGSNAPLFSGIIAGVTGGIIVGIFSGSQLSVSGPAAGLTAIIVVAISKLPTFEVFLVSVVIAGLFQLIFGFLKAGFLGDYVPSPVIKGMLAAIGIILILKQIPHLVGYHADFEGDEAFKQMDGKNTFSEIITSSKWFVPLAAAIGIISLLIQIVWDNILIKRSKLFKLIPSALIVVLASVAINQFFIHYYPHLALKSRSLVNIPVAATTEVFFSFFSFPDFSFLGNFEVWKTAATLAIVASLETLLNLEATDKVDPLKRVSPPNRELKAQGLGNVISGLLGGLPVTSVIVRTSANINAGGKTKMATIMHGILLLLCVAFIPRILNMIPLPALAGVLVYTGFKLAKPSIFKAIYQKGWDQFLPFVVTVVAILLTDLLIGILIGCMLGFVFVLRSNFKSAVFVVNDNNRYLFRLRKDVSFLNKPIIKTKLEMIPENAFVLIDTTRADFIDKEIIEVIEDFMKHAKLKNIRVELKKSQYKVQGFAIGQAPILNTKQIVALAH